MAKKPQNLSMFVRRSNPFGTSYDIPANVRAEGRRAVVTDWAPGGTIDDATPMGMFAKNGFDIPSYAREPHGVTPNVTPWAPRGTVDPAALKRPSVLAPRTPDPKEIYANHATPKDPFVMFGQDVADAVLDSVSKLKKPTDRTAALKASLSAIDPDLYYKVDQKMQEYAKSMPAKEALHKAISVASSNHVLNEVMEYGTGKRKPSSRKGLMGLGTYGPASDAWSKNGVLLNSDLYGPLGLGSWWNPIDDVKSLGRGIKSGAGDVYDAAKDVVNKVQDITCALSNSGALTLAAAAGGAAAGGAGGAQAGAAGGQVVQNLCGPGKGGGAAPIVNYAPPPEDHTLLYVGIGAAALVAILLLTKKRPAAPAPAV